MLGALGQLSFVQGKKVGFFFHGLMMQKQERNDIFPQVAFSHATTLFQWRCKNPKGKYLKKIKHKLFKISKPDFNFLPHCSQHRRSSQWSEKGNKRGTQSVPFCRKWLNSENSVISSSDSQHLHVQLWDVKSHCKTKLLEYLFFCNAKDLQKHLSKEKSLDESMDLTPWNLGLYPNFVLICPLCHTGTKL